MPHKTPVTFTCYVDEVERLEDVWLNNEVAKDVPSRADFIKLMINLGAVHFTRSATPIFQDNWSTHVLGITDDAIKKNIELNK